MATLWWLLPLVCMLMNILQAQNDDDDECEEEEAWNTDEQLMAAGEASDNAWNAIKGDFNPQLARRLRVGPAALGDPDPIEPIYNTLDIPIVFHILYNAANNTDGIAADEDQQWYSQYVEILRKLHLDFNAANPDITEFPEWQARIGDMNLTFFINRIIYADVGSNSPYPPKSSSSSSPPYTLLQSATAGSAPIDADHHLDLWFAYGQKSFAAYAYRPPFQALGRHGATFNIEYLTGARTRPTLYTHELGHWVGLKHIWGLSNRQGQASCDLDDDIDDTPNMASKWKISSSDTCPADLSGNTCGAGDPGDEPDMFDNFMSYALPCRNFYTFQQVQRARVAEDANGTPIGIRASFYEYQDASIAAKTKFVSFFYFVDKLEECMVGDHKREFCKRNNGKFRVCCEWALCVSFSQNPFVDVYEDLEMIIGDTASCTPGFQRIDNVLMPDKGGETDSLYVCYKKVPQTDPMAGTTIIDLDLEHLGWGMRLSWIDKDGNLHSQTEDIPDKDMVTPSPTTDGWWRTPSPTTPAPTWNKPTTPKPTWTKPTTVSPTTSEPTKRWIKPTTPAPTWIKPTTPAPTWRKPTTASPTTPAPTWTKPTTATPTTAAPTWSKPTTGAPTTASPTWKKPTTPAPTTSEPTKRWVKPTTAAPTWSTPTTAMPTWRKPTTDSPTTASPTWKKPTTSEPTTSEPTKRWIKPTTAEPTTPAPTWTKPSTPVPTWKKPTTAEPTWKKRWTHSPTRAPDTDWPSRSPSEWSRGDGDSDPDIQVKISVQIGRNSNAGSQSVVHNVNVKGADEGSVSIKKTIKQ